MKFKLLLLVAILSGISTFCSLVSAQEDETYDFDGVADMDPQPADPTDWMTSENWSDGGFDPHIAFGPLIPDFGTRVEIQTSTFGVDAPAIGPGDNAQAFGVRIGRAGGEGLLTMTGGTLDLVDSCNALPFTCNRRLRVGAADVSLPAQRNPGTFNLSDGVVTTDTLWIGSGSYGEMNMSGGTVDTRGDLSMDWTFDAGSTFNFTDGTVNVGTNLRMYRNSILDLDGGTMMIGGFAGLGYRDGNVTQIPNAMVTIRSGLMEAAGFLRVEGSTIVDGGILRADRFEESLSSGTVELNEGGTLQFANESIQDIQTLITNGFITTSSPMGTNGFVIEVVDVNGVDFTQIAFGSVVTGDFNGDGNWDCLDIDALTAAVASMSTDLSFDMNGDGSITAADITDAGTGWLAVGGANNPAATSGGNPFLSGDANLDGAVNGQDFVAWNTHKFTSNSAWCSGDFNASGAVDGQDFVIWNNNKFQTSDGQALAVPEPTGILFWLVMTWGGLGIVRRFGGQAWKGDQC